MVDLTWDEAFHAALAAAALTGDWEWARSPHDAVARRLLNALDDAEGAQECPTTPPTTP